MAKRINKTAEERGKIQVGTWIDREIMDNVRPIIEAKGLSLSAFWESLILQYLASCTPEEREAAREAIKAKAAADLERLG